MKTLKKINILQLAIARPIYGLASSFQEGLHALDHHIIRWEKSTHLNENFLRKVRCVVGNVKTLRTVCRQDKTTKREDLSGFKKFDLLEEY